MGRFTYTKGDMFMETAKRAIQTQIGFVNLKSDWKLLFLGRQKEPNLENKTHPIHFR